MELFDTIAKRHSYRGNFKDQVIPEADLRKIVQAGICAPSGCNAQTTDFIIINQLDLIQQVCRITGEKYKYILTAQAIIACVVEVEKPIYHGHSFEVEDCAAAVENILLAITALGYASVWIDGALRVEQRAQQIGQLLNVPSGKVVRIILPLGVPVERRQQKIKRPFDERAWFNGYPD